MAKPNPRMSSFWIYGVLVLWAALIALERSYLLMMLEDGELAKRLKGKKG